MIIPTISDLDALAPTNPIMISSEEIDELLNIEKLI